MHKPLWTADDFIRAVNGKTSGADATWSATGLSIDTRTLAPGDVFIALAGEQTDGHDYIAQAFKAGAVAALVRDDCAYEGGTCVRVKDVSVALWALAQAARTRAQAHIIAVTGSVGKTSVKEFLRAALGKTNTTHASEKSFNNHIGVPLSLASLPSDCAYAVFELGMNHAGEIAALARLVQPHTAIITWIAEAHIEHFTSLADIARAKAEIAEGLVKDGTLIIPADAPHCDIVLAHAKAVGITHITPFSLSNASAIELTETHSTMRATINGTEIMCKIALPGMHHVSNALAVLLAVDACGGDVALAAACLGEARMDDPAISGRGQRYRLGSASGAYTLIDESYNANPASMRAALAMLGLAPRLGAGRRIAALGDMAELGINAPALHRDLADAVIDADIDMVVSCGTLMQHLHNALPHERAGVHTNTAQDLHTHLASALRADDVVMVKGSRAAHMDTIISALRANHQEVA